MTQLEKRHGRPNIVGVDKGVGPAGGAQALRVVSAIDDPVTVRDVCDHLVKDGYFGIQGVLNRMNRLTQKGILARTERQGSLPVPRTRGPRGVDGPGHGERARAYGGRPRSRRLPHAPHRCGRGLQRDCPSARASADDCGNRHAEAQAVDFYRQSCYDRLACGHHQRPRSPADAASGEDDREWRSRRSRSRTGALAADHLRDRFNFQLSPHSKGGSSSSASLRISSCLKILVDPGGFREVGLPHLNTDHRGTLRAADRRRWVLAAVASIRSNDAPQTEGERESPARTGLPGATEHGWRRSRCRGAPGSLPRAADAWSPSPEKFGARIGNQLPSKWHRRLASVLGRREQEAGSFSIRRRGLKLRGDNSTFRVSVVGPGGLKSLASFSASGDPALQDA